MADAFTVYSDALDQVGVGGVLNFTFAADCHMIFVYIQGSLFCRATVDGSTPTNSRGIFCDYTTITPIPFFLAAGQTMKVFAPSGATVSAWGMGYS